MSEYTLHQLIGLGGSLFLVVISCHDNQPALAAIGGFYVARFMENLGHRVKL
jgi:hypothetical protein